MNMLVKSAGLIPMSGARIVLCQPADANYEFRGAVGVVGKPFHDLQYPPLVFFLAGVTLPDGRRYNLTDEDVWEMVDNQRRSD